MLPTYVEFTLHDFSPIFHLPTGFDKSPTNARHRRQIGARSREWQSHSVNYQRCDLRESRCVADTRKIFGMLNIWSCLRFTILLCEWVLTEIHRRWHTANERARYRQREARGGLVFFFFTKLLMVTFFFHNFWSKIWFISIWSASVSWIFHYHIFTFY